VDLGFTKRGNARKKKPKNIGDVYILRYFAVTNVYYYVKVIEPVSYAASLHPSIDLCMYIKMHLYPQVTNLVVWPLNKTYTAKLLASVLG